MLEPNLKEGAGGLRDVQAIGWAGLTLGPDGFAALVHQGYLPPDDPDRLTAAKALLLDVRVALHRVTQGRADVLALQDQDAVAAALGMADADVLARRLSSAGRMASWIAGDVWARLLAAQRGPGGRIARRDRAVADGVILRDGRVTVASDAPVDAGLVLRAAVAAATTGTDLDRETLERFRNAMSEPVWGVGERDAFVALLAAGDRAIPVIEALDHVGVFEQLLPEWAHVRSLPQRNAYHRFTVDRHLLEAVGECVRLRHEPGRAGDVARRARTDVLLLAALLHDIGKGLPGDHSDVGAEVARAVADRIGVESSAGETLAWLVRNHLLLAKVATRRDLSEAATITRFGRAVGDAPRLDLLYALTVGDSRATGPAAWNASKAALLEELFVRTDALLERGTVVSPLATERRAALAELIGAAEADAFLDAMPPAYAVSFSPELLAHHRTLLEGTGLVVEWSELSDGRRECTVVAPDRPGLLATVAGVLALAGFDIRDAAGYSHRTGTAIEVFTGVDHFGRLAEDAERARVATTLDEALRGTLALDERLRERARRYRAPMRAPGADAVRVDIDLDASDFATVVEVHAPDEVGLLARVAAVFSELGLDVAQALVATLADHVVDVFYVRDASGAKVRDEVVLARLRAALTDRLAGELAET
jgi:[protein-PII] uridylyltransferase